MKSRFTAVLLGCAMILGVSTPAIASKPATADQRCDIVVAQARSYDRRHHRSTAGLGGPCTAAAAGSDHQHRMRARGETMCHPNGNGNFCCTFDSGPARCGSCPSMSAPCPH